MTYEEAVCRNIRELRTEKRLTQAQFAEKIGMSQQFVSRLETEIVVPDFVVGMSICRVLGIKPERLLKGGGGGG